jgi:riboflavin synthase
MKIGIADTTFARVDMANFAIDEIRKSGQGIVIERYTVPGIKDLPVACKILFEDHDCSIVLALGMVGGMPIDRQCSHEANISIQQVQLMVNKHILGVFVHEDEGKDEKDLLAIFEDRTRKHARNAIALLNGKDELRSFAGSGKRQGRDDVGRINNVGRLDNGGKNDALDFTL